MKLYLPIFLIFSFLNIAFSQNSINFEKAEKQYKSHNYKKSIDLYELALKDNQHISYIYGQMAFAHLFLKQYEEAKTNFESAIAEDSTISDYYNGLGLAKAYLNDINGAIADFSKAIELDPKFSQPYLNRGSAYLSIKKIDEAIKDLETAEKLDHNNPEINFQIARMYYKKDSLEKSIKNYNKAEQKGLISKDLYLDRASVYFKLGQLENAVKDYTTILKKEPNNTDALNNRAVIYDKLGKDSLAAIDRNKLFSITGTKFEDPRTFKYTRVYSKDSLYSMEVPAHWIVKKTSMDNEDIITITIPQADSLPQFRAVNITLSFNSNMMLRYGVSEQSELIKFWQNSQLKNTKGFSKYNMLSQKQFMLNDWFAVRFLTQTQKTPNSLIINMYELVTAKPNQLFYGYFQAPDVYFKYYQPIFDRLIKSIVIKGK